MFTANREPRSFSLWLGVFTPYKKKSAGSAHPKQAGQGCWHKFETLILDMVYMMDNCLPFEVEREKEFAPVKNALGTDSVESARELLKKNGIAI